MKQFKNPHMFFPILIAFIGISAFNTIQEYHLKQKPKQGKMIEQAVEEIKEEDLIQRIDEEIDYEVEETPEIVIYRK